MVPQLISLLRAVSENRLDLKLSSFDEARIRWSVASGLGPLLFRAIKHDPQAVASPLWTLLRGADLSARVIVADHVDAMIDIIEGCQRQGVSVTLLKGISISDQHYPEAHLRPMLDIDFLVEEKAISDVQCLLTKLGYRQRAKNSGNFYETHHHLPPFVHPETGVWVEVHRRLFPSKSKLGCGEVFGPQNVNAQLKLSEFHGKPIIRLSNELQIVYIASHWAQDFSTVGGMVAMVDAIYLLKKSKTIDWEKILDWTHLSAASTHTYLLLSYLARYHLADISPKVLRQFSGSRSARSVNVRILHWLIDEYLVGGRPVGPALTERALDIVWKGCLLPERPWRSFLLIPLCFSLPARLRQSLLDCS